MYIIPESLQMLEFSQSFRLIVRRSGNLGMHFAVYEVFVLVSRIHAFGHKEWLSLVIKSLSCHYSLPSLAILTLLT